MKNKILKVLLLIAMTGACLFCATKQPKQKSMTVEEELRYENQISKLQSQLRDTEEELQHVTEELSRYEVEFTYNVAAAPIYDVALSDELQQYTYDMCRYYEIEQYYEVALAVMWKESNFDASAISSTNDYGLMQINISNHSFLKQVLGVEDMLDPKDNIQCGVYLLSNLVQTYDTIDQALMAYNMGPGGAAELWSRGIYTSPYSLDVLSRLEQLNQK